jgi:ATP-dependent helicase/nuclease subunit A
VAATADSLGAVLCALDTGWDAARACAQFSFPRAGSVRGYEEEKAVRARCKAALKKLTELFACASAELVEDMEAVRPAVEELLGLVLEFDRAYAAEKKRRGLIDFSDQEHLTARLRADPGTGEPTALARSVAQRYREILIDEYQDINGIQELIFQACSRGGRNIFMVGDVKQSIYRFRLADPSIFLSKYKSYADLGAEDGGRGRRIFMSTNFRSKKGVLDAVNFVFKNIMSEPFGEMDYSEREFLYPGRADAASEGRRRFPGTRGSACDGRRAQRRARPPRTVRQSGTARPEGTRSPARSSAAPPRNPCHCTAKRGAAQGKMRARRRKLWYTERCRRRRREGRGP